MKVEESVQFKAYVEANVKYRQAWIRAQICIQEKNSEGDATQAAEDMATAEAHLDLAKGRFEAYRKNNYSLMPTS